MEWIERNLLWIVVVIFLLFHVRRIVDAIVFLILPRVELRRLSGNHLVYEVRRTRALFSLDCPIVSSEFQFISLVPFHGREEPILVQLSVLGAIQSGRLSLLPIYAMGQESDDKFEVVPTCYRELLHALSCTVVTVVEQEFGATPVVSQKRVEWTKSTRPLRIILQRAERKLHEMGIHLHLLAIAVKPPDGKVFKDFITCRQVKA